MKIKTITIVLIALGMIACAKTQDSQNEQQAPEPVVRYEWGLPIDSFRIDTCEVKNGETLGGIMNKLGATRQQINILCSLSDRYSRCRAPMLLCLST